MKSGYACTIPEGYADIGNWDPIEFAKNAIKDGRVSLYGVNGFSFEVPGIPGSSFCWYEAGLAKAIPGTTDAICIEEDESMDESKHGQFQNSARSFATTFNKYVFENVFEIQNHKCAS